jgi:hypothetical protein
MEMSAAKRRRLRKVQMERDTMQREVSQAKRAAGLSFHAGWHDSDSKAHRDWLKLQPVPNDTRNLTQRICGDPLPERSALYRRTQEDGR